MIDLLSPTKKKAIVLEDGGYGWIVVLASFCISLIADGVSFSFGLLYMEFLIYFKESKSKTAWIGSLFLAVPLLVGPIMSNLVEKYGCRRMTIFGGLLSSFGFALASICDSLETLYLTFGIISGIGLGVGYVTAVVSISFWFDKKRTLANGIGASGTGIGTFIYAPFTQWLISQFGWRGATLILAATMTHTCFFGLLMHDPHWLKKENFKKKCYEKFSKSSYNINEMKQLSISNSFHSIPIQSDLIMQRCQSETSLPSFYFENQLFDSLDDIESNSCTNNKTVRIFFFGKATNLLSGKTAKLKHNYSYLGRNKSIKNANYFKSKPVLENYFHTRFKQRNIDRTKLKTWSCPNLNAKPLPSIKQANKDVSHIKNDVTKSILDFSLFLNLKFTMFNLSTFLLFTWFIIPYFYITEHMKMHDYAEEDGAFLLSLIGISNTLGMLAIGVIGDKPWLNINVTYSICMLLCGLSIALMPISTNYYSGLIVLSITFGLTFSSTFSLTPSILVEIVKFEDFTCAYGLVLLVQGIGSLVGPPVAGIICDITSRFDDSFYTAGFFIALSGGLSYIVEILKKRDY